MINSITVSGHLGKDVETKQAGEHTVAQFTLANTVGYGEKKHTNWINCVAWRGLGENCARYLAKGSKAIVTGELRIRSYDTDNGKRYVTEIICRDVEFVTRREAGADDGMVGMAAGVFGGQIVDEDILF